jgi:hypothetical protein
MSEKHKAKLQEKIAKLTKGKDKYMIVLAQLGKDGNVIDFDIATWDFPINDMPKAASKIQSMINLQYKEEKRRLLEKPEDKEAREQAEELKNSIF